MTVEYCRCNKTQVKLQWALHNGITDGGTTHDRVTFNQVQLFE
jgi:hypothetical protein